MKLKQDYRLLARQHGRPALFARIARGDSMSVQLWWDAGRVVSSRHEQGMEIDPDAFSELVSDYAEGGTWHEWDAPPDSSPLKRAYPGLEQQWILKGFRGNEGWLGSGLHRGRFFLVFTASAPASPAPAKDPLRLVHNLPAVLDTAAGWLRVGCREFRAHSLPAKGKPARGASLPVCYSPTDNPRLQVRIDKRSPLVLQVWLAEGDSLDGVRRAMQSLGGEAQREYARDLSQLLLSEAQGFLVRVSQRVPWLTNWPSWQFQEFADGRLPPESYLDLLNREGLEWQGSQGMRGGDSLPAFRYAGRRINLAINLYYHGAFHLTARELP